MIEFSGAQQGYSESGIDLALLRHNLQLSVNQRLLRNARSLAGIKAVVESMRRNGPPTTTRKWSSTMVEIEAILRQRNKDKLHLLELNELKKMLGDPS